MEEERRILRQRCSEVQSGLRSAESSNSQLSAELALCRGQLSAVQSRLDHAEAVSDAASRRDGALRLVNADLRRDVDRAEHQVHNRLTTDCRSVVSLSLIPKTMYTYDLKKYIIVNICMSSNIYYLS